MSARLAHLARPMRLGMTLLVAIGGVSWLAMARVIRGQVLSLKEQPFIEAARATGAEQCAPLQSAPRRREDTAGAVAEATSDKCIHGHAYRRPHHGPAVAAPAPGEAAAAAIVW